MHVGVKGLRLCNVLGLRGYGLYEYIRSFQIVHIEPFGLARGLMSDFNIISNDCVLITIMPVPLQVPGNKTNS